MSMSLSERVAADGATARVLPRRGEGRTDEPVHVHGAGHGGRPGRTADDGSALPTGNGHHRPAADVVIAGTLRRTGPRALPGVGTHCKEVAVRPGREQEAPATDDTALAPLPACWARCD
jgi:hypothetical protein